MRQLRELPISRLLLAAGLALGGAVLLTGQATLDPGEISVRSAVYFPRRQFSLRADVRLVEVLVVVKDRDGRVVPGLRRDQFEVRDVGKKREIAAFSVQTATRAAPAAAPGAPPATAAPSPPAAEVRRRYVGIVFDDLNTDFAEFRRSQIAARRFVREGLSSGDRVGLFSTYGQQILPFTSSADTLEAAIEKMRFRSRKSASSACPEMSEYESYLIANNMDPELLDVKVTEASVCYPSYEAPTTRARGGVQQNVIEKMNNFLVAYVVGVARTNWGEVRIRSLNTLNAIQGIVDSMSSLPGSRMILLASGGFLSRDLATEQDNLITHALRSGVVINSLDAKGLYTLDLDMPPGGDAQSLLFLMGTLTDAMVVSNDAMAGLAQSTGGRFFRGSNDLAGGFRQLGEQPEVTYLLAFRPDPQPDGKYHKLEVRLAGGNRYSVQARPGYFASKEEPVEQAAERRIDRELFGTEPVAEVPASITTKVDKQASGAATLTATFHVEIKRLSFVERSGLRSERLNLLVALLDEEGNFVAGKEGSMAFSLRESTFVRLSETGLAANLELEAPAGKYRMRGLIETENQGKLTAIDQAVEIP